MPNWVYNTLAVTGEPELVEEFRVAISQPYESRHAESVWDEETKTWNQIPKVQMIESVFSAWNIIHPEDEILDEYFSVADAERPANNWYAWNLKNWGTKWGACDSEILDDETYSGVRTILYKYETAWGTLGQEFMAKMSQMFPFLIFHLEYEEEQGWGGEESWKNGDCYFSSEYDIPNSHADYQERDRDCICVIEDDQEYWFSDCPRQEVSV